MGLDRLLQLSVLRVLVIFQIRIDLPDLGMHPVEFFGVCGVQRKQALKDPLGMNPTQGVQQDIKLPGIVTDDDQIRRKAAGEQGAQQRPLGGDTDMPFVADPELS